MASHRRFKLREAQRRVARQWQGLSRHHPLKDYPRELIERGADVEVEHVGYRPIARRIAADHLTEDRAYYEKLAKMEGRSGGRAGYYIVEGMERVSSEFPDPATAIGVAEGYYRNNVARGRTTSLPVSVVRARSMSEASGLAEFGEEPFARGTIVWKNGRDPRQQDLPFGRAGGQRSKGAPTDLNLFTLHKELGNHLRMFGQAEPLHRFEPTSMAGLRRLVKAGYLVPAEGQPKGYWTLSGVGTYEYELWLQRNAGRYGIPEAFGRSHGVCR